MRTYDIGGRRSRTYEPAPTGALNSSGGGIELLLEGVNRSKSLLDSFLERAILKDTAVALAFSRRRSKILPEEGMINVP